MGRPYKPVMPRTVEPYDWEDDAIYSDSAESIDVSPVYSNACGANKVPEVLYSVNYVDSSRRQYGTIGSNREMKVTADGADTASTVDEAEGKPVIEIRTVAICASKNSKARLSPFKNIYHQAESESEEDSSDGEEVDADDANEDTDDDGDDNDEEKEIREATQKLEIEAVRKRFTVTSVDSKRMIIHSEYLQDAIDAVNESTHSKPQLKEPYPRLYHMREDLARFRDNQPKCHGAEQRETTARHIDVLLNYLEKTLGDKCRDEERLYAQSPPMATFGMSWLMYKPHEIAYAKRHPRRNGAPMHWRAYIIKSVDMDLTQLRVHCWSLAYSGGTNLKREATTFTVKQFTGEQAIQELPLIPERFFPQKPELQDGLSMADWQIKLGRQFWGMLQGPAYKEFVVPIDENVARDQLSEGAEDDGTASKAQSRNEHVERVVADLTGFGKFGSPQFSPPPGLPPGAYGGYGISHNTAGPNGAPMGSRPPPPPQPVDPGMVMQFEPRCGCDVCWDNPEADPRKPGRFFEFSTEFMNSRKTPTSDLFYHLCDVEVPAFFLSKRKWLTVHLAELRPVKTDHEAFENLVLDPEIKTTVRALVGKFAHDVKGRTESVDSGAADSSHKNYDSGRVAPWPRDIVKNKGEGRIFLLHGSPGVGKTCTAECIAELAQRPLLALTSGDISTEMHADVVERNLDNYLRLGERYGALVLLDEADVFLEARRASDLRRNGLVSVFLRALEYFRGVLFLTTNRVETFDDAFTSRIHVALHYSPLSAESRRRVWMQHFARIERDSGGRIFVLRSAREYAYEDAQVHSLSLNGREIRNALQTAVALAEADALDKAAAYTLPDASNKGKEVEGEENDGKGQVAVTEAHLRAVIKMSAGFKLFMIDAKAKGDSVLPPVVN